MTTIKTALIASCFALTFSAGSSDTTSPGLAADATLIPGGQLAAPQPEAPICSYCTLDIPEPSDDESSDEALIMEIDPAYAGQIFDIEFKTYDMNRNRTVFHFDAAVIEDLNDPSTVGTIVALQAPNTVVASLVFTLATGETRVAGVTIIDPQ